MPKNDVLFLEVVNDDTYRFGIEKVNVGLPELIELAYDFGLNIKEIVITRPYAIHGSYYSCFEFRYEEEK